MPFIGLIVEGEDDELSYEVFLKNINPELNIQFLRLNGCDKEKLKNTFKILNQKIKNPKYSRVEKGLIICDCDSKCAPDRAKFIKDAINIKDPVEELENCIKIHATCKELETLFLTCIDEIKFIDGKDVNFKKIKNPENISYPKEHLRNLLLKEENIIYGKKVAEEIASQINVNKLEERSDNFKRLKQIVDNFAFF